MMSWFQIPNAISPKEVCWRDVPPLSTTLLFVPHKKVPKFSFFCTWICIVQSHIWKMYVLHLLVSPLLKEIGPGYSLNYLFPKFSPYQSLCLTGPLWTLYLPTSQHYCVISDTSLFRSHSLCVFLYRNVYDYLLSLHLKMMKIFTHPSQLMYPSLLKSSVFPNLRILSIKTILDNILSTIFSLTPLSLEFKLQMFLFSLVIYFLYYLLPFFDISLFIFSLLLGLLAILFLTSYCPLLSFCIDS